MCLGFLCGSVHINGMSEMQNLTLLLQSGLGSQCCPNWLRLHPTPPPPSARHLGEPLPTTVSEAPSQKIEEARDVLNSSISVSNISQETDSKEEGNTNAQDLDRWEASEARGSGSLNPPASGTVMGKTRMPSEWQLTRDGDMAASRCLLTVPARERCKGQPPNKMFSGTRAGRTNPPRELW